MKKINPPSVNDIGELQSLANNARLSSHPQLLNEYIQFRSQYSSYITHGGDPWKINQIPINNQLKKALILHYSSPPTGRLKFITEYRRTLSPILCPMCGGFGNGTLDHYLPKDDFPEYSFFSKNLVPACNCNSLRGVTVKGGGSPERVIHPYFDSFLDQRLYQSVFNGSFDTPRISIEVIDKNHPEVGTLNFHLKEVISNDATQGWFEKYWSDLSQRAHDILDIVLPPAPKIVTNTDLKAAIEKYRNSKDKEYDTPNNWLSIFYTGLMNDPNRIVQLAAAINSSR